MANPTERAARAIGALAVKHGLSLDDSRLGDRKVRIHTLYAGGTHLLRLTDSVEISFAQCGAGGNWLAILPVQTLMELLETESVFDRLEKERN